MKRTFYLMLLMLLLVAFSGCGSKETPGTLIEYDVEGHLNYYELLDLEYYSDINCSFEHNWDGDANTDTVDVTVNVVYPYGTDIFEGQMVYLYDRASDNWSLIRTEGLVDYKTEFNAAALEGTWWIDYSRDPDELEDYLEYSVYFEKIDLDNMTVEMVHAVSSYEAVYMPGAMNIMTFQEFEYTGSDEWDGIYNIENEKYIHFNSFYGEHFVRFDKIDGVMIKNT